MTKVMGCGARKSSVEERERHCCLRWWWHGNARIFANTRRTPTNVCIFLVLQIKLHDVHKVHRCDERMTKVMGCVAVTVVWKERERRRTELSSVVVTRQHWYLCEYTSNTHKRCIFVLQIKLHDAHVTFVGVRRVIEKIRALPCLHPEEASVLILL